ncbi:TIGR03571 family LLM class oxidoreductase [Burkholderia sp. Ac-20365]|uniref:TIGR03571 family LLM class oxidoreductase n=1 Tax=Burkholderia sp. Ac-20365 TaxID=2703897 RepID=UPI00197B5596|nr:TIGR03571 family LLM class oxidoreductase [Burkholderia sp. Ac-20365]MBN3761637.1 TIGR03571 family LLM class oxidoreductase [Burkholderia sp. Ac-20365]
MDNALDYLVSGGFSLGVELPLDNDWVTASLHGKRPGIPDMSHHAELAQLVDRLGFRAMWVRDVPLFDPSFGDAGQTYDAFTYLGYLAAITRRILLGTAAIVLPLREPLLTLKSAATIQRLSNDRVLLGVASGDRPVEYPIFRREYDLRGENFREQIAVLRSSGRNYLPRGIEVLPELNRPLPLLVAGLAQQQLSWLGEHMDGCLAYPGTADDHRRRSAAWRAVAGNKPYISVLHLDLAENPYEPLARHRFGVRAGHEALIAELMAMRAAGVQHLSLHFRRNHRPIKETLQELGSEVLPHFHSNDQTLMHLS